MTIERIRVAALVVAAIALAAAEVLAPREPRLARPPAPEVFEVALRAAVPDWMSSLAYPP